MFSKFRILVGVIAVGLVMGPSSFAQSSSNAAVEDATRESIKRQAAKVDLRAKIAKAQEAEKAGKNAEASRLYEECLVLLKSVNSGVDAESAQVKGGMATSRLALAQQAQRGGDLLESEKQIDRVLVVDPSNKAAQDFKHNLERVKAQLAGKSPSPEALAVIPEANAQQVKMGTKLQDSKVLIEAGRLTEAESKLKEVLEADPNNQAAYYYLNVIREQRHNTDLAKREGWARDQFAAVTREWMDPKTRDALPQPNPYARTNNVNTSRARQAIYSKLSRISINEIKFDSKVLSEVVKDLGNEALKRDPDRAGINVLLAPNIDVPVAAPTLDANGQPVPAPADSVPLLGEVNINIPTALHNVTMAELLDAIVKVADRPIKYSVEDYAIVFSFRGREAETLYTRNFRVDPNTFRQGLESVTASAFGSEGGSGGGTGGGSGGGGGGGGRSGGGGGGGGQGGQGGQAQEQLGSTFAGVRIASILQGQGQVGGAQGAQGGIPSTPTTYRGELGLPGQGVTFLTRPAYTQVISETVRNFFIAAGVTLDPPKQLFYNDRTGVLMVRATLSDLDIIEQAIQVLNIPPPQLSIKARFAEVNLNQNRALGFDWFLGNSLLDKGRIGAQGGTAPSFDGNATAANPYGIFPFPDATGFNRIAPSTTDGLLTSGLRNDTTPTLGTVSGILTDPQFRFAIRALEQRGGINVLNAPEVVTTSARQTQIKAVDVKFVVTDLNLNQTGSGGTGAGAGGVNVTTGAGAGGVASAIQPIATPIELGPILDVIPYVSADGFTIQMTIIPTLKEFTGYDLDTANLFQAQAQSVGGVPTATLRQPIPLPNFRLRQIATTAIVWDGQTVVLGGLISESETKTKDKVPFLGDLPLFGRLFRSESNISDKKNLMIFVTPTIIDPAGNRVHSEEEMPFAKTAIPTQTPFAATTPSTPGK